MKLGRKVLLLEFITSQDVNPYNYWRPYELLSWQWRIFHLMYDVKTLYDVRPLRLPKFCGSPFRDKMATERNGCARGSEFQLFKF